MNEMRGWALEESAKWIRSVRNDGIVEDSFQTPEEIEAAKRELGRVVFDLLKAAGVRACRTCGCSDEDACEGGCSWVTSDLCSACDDQPKSLVAAFTKPEPKPRPRRKRAR